MHEAKRNPTKRVVCDYIAIMTDIMLSNFIIRILESLIYTLKLFRKAVKQLFGTASFDFHPNG
ncbi:MULTISPECIES: hypothetical protein [Parageobacillus]|uniref:hypothetical protein n=1 Tax=Parageobacillus TaxID=1906945 RepID=UPI0011314780|nr:hypothetical protein IC802_15195 [Geobacillus sp. 44C]